VERGLKFAYSGAARKKTSVPFHLDCAYRRCCPPEWNELQPVDQWIEEKRRGARPQDLAELAVKDPEGFFQAWRRRPSRRWGRLHRPVFAAGFFTDDHRLRETCGTAVLGCVSVQVR